MSSQSQDPKSTAFVVLINAVLLIHGGISNLKQNYNYLKFLKARGVEIAFYTTDHQIQAMEPIFARLGFHLGDMAEIIQDDPSRYYWVVDGEENNLELAKKLGARTRTILLTKNVMKELKGSNVDLTITDVQWLIALIFPPI